MFMNKIQTCQQNWTFLSTYMADKTQNPAPCDLFIKCQNSIICPNKVIFENAASLIQISFFIDDDEVYEVHYLLQ